MKQKKGIKKIISLILIIILISFFFIIKSKKIEFQDNLIFFKIFSQFNKIKKEDEKTNQYMLQVSKGKINYKKINLMQTINIENLINRKIEPGTNGNFEIVLNSNYNLEYKIGFISKNAKPRNLQFSIGQKGKKYRTLESLQEELKGNINKYQTIKIPVFWEWEYETDLKGNYEDTKDGENIGKYNFEIYTVGKENN